MIPVAGTTVVPHLGRSACASFHSSTLPSDDLGGKSVDRFGMSLILIFIAVRRNTRLFVFMGHAGPAVDEIATTSQLRPRQNGKTLQMGKSRPKIRITNAAADLIGHQAGERNTFSIVAFSNLIVGTRRA